MSNYLQQPKHGWSAFKLQDDCWSLSYVDDVPVMILDLFLNFYRFGTAAVTFDAEETEYVFILTPYEVQIIEEDLHRYEISAETFISDVINDIREQHQEWVMFTVLDEENYVEIQRHRAEIDARLCMVQQCQKTNIRKE